MNKKIVILFILLTLALSGSSIYVFLNTPVTTNFDKPSPTTTTAVIIPTTPTEPEVVTPELVVPTSTETIVVEKPATSSPKIIKLVVPFTAQAPFGEWSDSRQQNGCEEASALMAVSWARGENFSLLEAKEKILAISDWEQEQYGGYVDTSAQDTVERIFKGYFSFEKVEVVNNIIVQDIITELENGHLVVVPANGQLLHNKYFQTPGPAEHMTVIIGYDYQTQEFITNDPGTRHGQNYRYSQAVLFGAIRDYPTGSHLPIVGTSKVMIVVWK
jgi:hypothetical protein